MKPYDRIKEIMFEKIKACERMEKSPGEYPYFDAIAQYLDEKAKKEEPPMSDAEVHQRLFGKQPMHSFGEAECMVLCDYSGKMEPKGLPCRKPLPCPDHSPSEKQGWRPTCDKIIPVTKDTDMTTYHPKPAFNHSREDSPLTPCEICRPRDRKCSECGRDESEELNGWNKCPSCVRDSEVVQEKQDECAECRVVGEHVCFEKPKEKQETCVRKDRCEWVVRHNPAENGRLCGGPRPCPLHEPEATHKALNDAMVRVASNPQPEKQETWGECGEACKHLCHAESEYGFCLNKLPCKDHPQPEKPLEKWKPTEGKLVWMINPLSDSVVRKEYFSWYRPWAVFPTRKSAQAASDKIKQLLNNLNK